MVLDINAGRQLGVNSKFFINPVAWGQGSPLGGSLNCDTVDLNSDVTRFVNPRAVMDMVNSSPAIPKMCKEMNIPVKINMTALTSLANGHLKDTRNTVNGILNKLPNDMRTDVNRSALLKAASLHDFGKVLIPEKILNKNGNLTPQERLIMEKHSELGAELLRTQNLDEKVLNLVKYHHQNAKGEGYPKIQKNDDYDINNQVLYAADIYSALREERSYKQSMPKNKALDILYNDVKKGKLDKDVFKALVAYANEAEPIEVKKVPSGQAQKAVA